MEPLRCISDPQSGPRRTSPPSGASSPSITRTSVVLPAPFGPISVTTSATRPQASQASTSWRILMTGIGRQRRHCGFRSDARGRPPPAPRSPDRPRWEPSRAAQAAPVDHLVGADRLVRGGASRKIPIGAAASASGPCSRMPGAHAPHRFLEAEVVVVSQCRKGLAGDGVRHWLLAPPRMPAPPAQTLRSPAAGRISPCSCRVTGPETDPAAGGAAGVSDELCSSAGALPMTSATVLGPSYIVAARRTALGRPGGLHRSRRLEAGRSRGAGGAAGRPGRGRRGR